MLNTIDLKVELILIQMGIDPCKFVSWKIDSLPVNGQFTAMEQTMETYQCALPPTDQI